MAEKMAVGVDLGGTDVKVAAVDLSGRVREETKVETGAEKGPEFVLGQIKKGIGIILSKFDRASFIGIGVGAAGIVKTEEGTVNYPPNFPGWEVINVRDRLQEEFGLPTFVDNDANVAAIGEGGFGAGVGYDDFLCITLGTGVGGGLFLNGKIYRGSGYGAGEIGHTVVKFDGPQCRCGNYGCLERFVGRDFIVERALERLKSYGRTSKLFYIAERDPSSISPKIISQLASEGDALCLEILRETGDIIGVALASVVNLLNLPLIIIGGGIAKAGDLLLKPIEESVRRRALPLPGKEVKIVAAKLGEWAGVIGAAKLAMDGVLE